MKDNTSKISYTTNKNKKEYTQETFLALPLHEREEAFRTFVFNLYKEIGWSVKYSVGKIELYADDTQEEPFLVVETIASIAPVTMEQTLSGLRNLLTHENNKMVAHRDYAILSLSGFEDDVFALEEFHCRLDGWEYVEKLMTHAENDLNKPIELLPHNQHTYRKIQEEWKVSKKVAVVQATGTGKTYLANQCMLDFNGKKKLVLAPTLPILNQFRSGMPKNISNIIYMTYQKAMFLKQEELNKLNVSFIVLDEFHRVGAEKWGEGVQKIMDQNPQSYVLGLSATPIRYLDNARDMADEVFGNHVAANLSLEEALAKNILPSPIYISALYTLDEEVQLLIERIRKSRNKDNEKKSYIKELDIIRKNWDKSMGIPNILKKHSKSHHNKFIVFTENKEHLIEMKGQVLDWFQEVYPTQSIKSFEVWSEKGRNENSETIEEFTHSKDKNIIHLLFSINMLNEGLHVDDVSGVVLLRKTVSPTIYYQQIGRALQTGKSEKPIVFDFVNNFNNVSVKYLLDKLNDAFDKEKRNRDHYNLPFTIPEFDVQDETMNVQQLFESIQSKLIVGWDELYQLLCDYKAEHGDCMVPHDFMYGERNLGNWVGSQRMLYKDGHLPQVKIEKLNELDFVWVLNEERWMDGYRTLVEFKEMHGDCNIPTGFILNGRNLESWTNAQRQAFKNNALSEEKIGLLFEIDFPFQPFDSSWMEMYDLLVQFEQQNKHTLVTRSVCCGEKRLGAWVEQQRYLYRYDRLPQERIEKLNEIGFVWERHSHKWMEMYKLLIEFKHQHGHFLIPSDYETNGYKVGNWVTEQRVNFKKGILEEYRLEKLKEIDFVWDHKEAIWDEMYQLLVKYKEEHGHTSVPSKYEVDGKILGTWAPTQRAFHKKGMLSEGRIKKLNQIQFVWDPHEQKWQDMYQALGKYIREQGTTVVPYSYIIDNKRLGAWLSSQKNYHKKGILPADRYQQLAEMNVF